LRLPNGRELADAPNHRVGHQSLADKFLLLKQAFQLRWLLLPLSVLSLLWPAFLNGEPLMFADTSAYVRAADAAVVKITGHSTVWTRDGEIERLSGVRFVPTSPVGPLEQNRVPLLGRSIYYGVFAYAAYLFGSFWLLALVQAAVLGVAALLLHRRLLGPGAFTDPNRLAALLLVLAVCTTAPFFCSFAMPDLFAGLSILAATLLLTQSGIRDPAERWVCFAIAAIGGLFHASHILLLLGLAVLALAARFVVRTKISKPGLICVAAAAGLGLAGEFVFVQGVTVATGESPIRPPFVTARLIDDGPGLRYLRDTCPQNGLFLCRFKDRLPLHSDTFLWGATAPQGVFNTLDPADKRRLASEQTKFVLQVVRERPFEVVASSLSSALHQLRLFQLPEFNYPGIFDSSGLPAAEQVKVARTRAMRGDMPTLIFGLFASTMAALALISLLLQAWEQRIDRRLVALVISGILLNAFICGALSTPHDRYGARVMWLLPMLAAAALLTPQSASRASASCPRRP